MKSKKIAFILMSVVLLTGCVQSTAFLGPAITVAATGNITQAGFTYGTNEVIKRETGKDTMQYVSDLLELEDKNLLEPEDKKATINEDLIVLVESNNKKARKKIDSKKSN